MTAARLSPLQRQVLEQLAHIRVAPEDAWMTTPRLATLADRGVDATYHLLRRLEIRYLVDGSTYLTNPQRWRITDKGREALG